MTLPLSGRLLAKGLILLAVNLGVTPTPSASQSEYHWSDQFGNRSTLLNGTMIGSVSDLSFVRASHSGTGLPTNLRLFRVLRDGGIQFGRRV